MSFQLICPNCRAPLDASGAAVAVLKDDKPRYVPFVEDLRSWGMTLLHVMCFIEQDGVDVFLEVLAEHDQRQRLGMYELRKLAISPRKRFRRDKA